MVKDKSINKKKILMEKILFFSIVKVNFAVLLIFLQFLILESKRGKGGGLPKKQMTSLEALLKKKKNTLQSS